MPALIEDPARPFCNHQMQFAVVSVDPSKRATDAQSIVISLKNIGDKNCRMFSKSSVQFKDKDDKTLPVSDVVKYDGDDLKKGKQTPSTTFGRGFPIPLIDIPSQATVTAKVVWNTYYKGRHCFEAHYISFNYYWSEGSIEPGSNNIPLHAKICGHFANWAVYSSDSLKFVP